MTSSGLLNPEEYHSASCKLGRSLELAAEYLAQLGALLEQMRADDRRLRVEHAELLAGCKRLLASITVDGVITIEAGRETCQAIDAIVLAVAGTKGVLTGMARQGPETSHLRSLP